MSIKIMNIYISKLGRKNVYVGIVGKKSSYPVVYFRKSKFASEKEYADILDYLLKNHD